MPETPADPVATELAGIRRRAEQITGEHDADSCDLNGETCTGHDAERLLGVVEAVLALAAKLSPQGRPASALEEDRMWIRQECADMIREVVAGELLSEGNERG